jgi:hypothetical protein
VPGSSPSSWTEWQSTDFGTATNASYYGVAADEYIVKMTSLGDLWTDLEDPAAQLAFELWTRHNPSAGDIWASTNGNSLYVYDGKEKFSLAGATMNTDRVLVYNAGNVDPEGGDLITQCIVTGSNQVDSTHPTGTDYAHALALLDPGCIGNFTHLQTGTQWWYGDVLVAYETTTHTVTVDDFGFEYYEKTGDTCYRQTTVESGESSRKLFVQYTLETTELTYQLDTYEQLKAAEVFAND